MRALVTFLALAIAPVLAHADGVVVGGEVGGFSLTGSNQTFLGPVLPSVFVGGAVNSELTLGVRAGVGFVRYDSGDGVDNVAIPFAGVEAMYAVTPVFSVGGSLSLFTMSTATSDTMDLGNGGGGVWARARAAWVFDHEPTHDFYIAAEAGTLRAGSATDGTLGIHLGLVYR